ncbi:hypothetical protein I6E09_13225 [Mediterraneibacter glycyrrhizinilyticus]|uniref:hypothetical protein n=1 Tax=Mediterraneibacter glycyrrhizinilyticus TaxID=342942 RepID=UPI0026582811|nr:hypothetical protein [Mediterraneibacter glycyrrhizinilyticus]MCF2570122.1 hypothetical protein [Mediterraneibacter glycyrrhizinilyticus]
MQHSVMKVERELECNPLIYQVMKLVSEIGVNKIGRIALKMLKGELKLMRTDDIRIFSCFKENPPKPEKMKEKEWYFQETGLFPSEIVLDSSNRLIDGYISFLLAAQQGIERIPVRYGKRQIVKAYHRPGGKIYIWELPKKLIDQVEPGEKVVVMTSKGVRIVRVKAVEEYNPDQHMDPLRQVIRKKKSASV